MQKLEAGSKPAACCCSPSPGSLACRGVFLGLLVVPEYALQGFVCRKLCGAWRVWLDMCSGERLLCVFLPAVRLCVHAFACLRGVCACVRVFAACVCVFVGVFCRSEFC